MKPGVTARLGIGMKLPDQMYIQAGLLFGLTYSGILQ